MIKNWAYWKSINEITNATPHYRFGFNGMLRDDDVRDEKLTSDNEGRGNSYDFGARILDPRVGRFLSLDPLMGSFPWQSPYVFAGNDPIRFIDFEGKWAKEVSSEWHIDLSRLFDNNVIPKNSKGYLADKINNEFYLELTKRAPKLAKFLEEKSIFVIQADLPKQKLAIADIGGDVIRFDLKQIDNLLSTFIHELTHLNGASEFQAYATEYSTGLLSKKAIEYGLTTEDNYEGFNKHFREGIPLEIRGKYFTPSGFLKNDETLKNEFFDYLQTVGDAQAKERQTKTKEEMKCLPD